MIAIMIANTHSCESAFLIGLYIDNMQNFAESKIMILDWLYVKGIYSSLDEKEISYFSLQHLFKSLFSLDHQNKNHFLTIVPFLSTINISRLCM